MRKLRAFISRHPIIADYVKSLLPDALRFDIYLKQRKAVLDQPGKALTPFVKRPLFYACFCLIAPIALLYAILYTGQSMGWIAAPQLDRSLGELRQLEGSIDSRIGEICRRHFNHQPELIPLCVTRLQERGNEDKADLRDAIAMGSYSQHVVTFLQSQTLLLSPIILIINAYFFAYFWTRWFPVHLAPTVKDRAVARRAYLVTLGTTLFTPSIFAACAIFVAELIQRSSASWTLISFAPTIAFFTNLPLFVASMLAAQRLHRLLNKADNWRVARPITIMLFSNLFTCLIVFPLLAVILIWL